MGVIRGVVLRLNDGHVEVLLRGLLVRPAHVVHEPCIHAQHNDFVDGVGAQLCVFLREDIVRAGINAFVEARSQQRACALCLPGKDCFQVSGFSFIGISVFLYLHLRKYFLRKKTCTS